ncbi:MAG: hypothetical protein A2901_07790 [Elusimicrobia bacterium RIFCSPLOWO2_01_FULL_54_10]|nr:MAG: hypothetical protein A2901_07790 [Elusimicrobia bacterium RIFCSPLOWO2_01_FULL_54_10]
MPDTICATHSRGDHIDLTCKNHPELRWSTKNIGTIGDRNIFFSRNLIVAGIVECECPIGELIHVCDAEEE